MEKSWAERQRNFMLAGDQTTKGLNMPQAQRYLDHIKEEVCELVEAWVAKDMVASLDGAADLIVVAMGFIESHGIPSEEIMNAVLRANERKIVNGALYRREDGQIGKPPGFIGPDKEIIEAIEIAEMEAAEQL